MNYDIERTPCPVCGRELDQASPTTKGAPRPSCGDIAVCLSCAAVLRVTCKGLRQVTVEELVRESPEVLEEIAHVIRAARNLRVHSN